MSLKHPSVHSYWNQASVALDQYLAAHRDIDAEGLSGLAVALFAYTMEDVQQKVSKNTTNAPKLLPLMVLGFDTLRGLVAAQQHLSLATVIVCGRTIWEAKVRILFIAGSKTPDLYADRFARFVNVERLRRHYSGRVPLSASEEAALKAQCKEWVDAKTDTLKKPHQLEWTAEGITVKKQADAAGEKTFYETYYSISSLFIHTAAVGQRMYMKGNDLNTIADAKMIRLQSAIASVNAIGLLTAYAKFCGIPLPMPELQSFHIQAQTLMKS